MCVFFPEEISHALQDSSDHQLPWPLYLCGSSNCGLCSLLMLKASIKIIGNGAPECIRPDRR